MGTVLGYIIALLIVGGLLFLAASFAFGRGEEMAPALPGGTPLELPDDRLAGGDDLRALRLSVAVRGYRMDEVDWLLEKLSEQVDTRDREIARLRSVLHVEPVPVPGAGDEPELLTHPHPPVRDLPLRLPDPSPDPAHGPSPEASREPSPDPSREPALEPARGSSPEASRDTSSGASREPRDLSAEAAREAAAEPSPGPGEG